MFSGIQRQLRGGRGLNVTKITNEFFMGARRNFSRGGQIRGSGDESPPVGSRGGRRRKIVKMMHK